MHTKTTRSTVRIAPPGSKPRNPVVQAVLNAFGTINGTSHEERRLAQQSESEHVRFELLDYDQQIRQVGEW